MYFKDLELEIKITDFSPLLVFSMLALGSRYARLWAYSPLWWNFHKHTFLLVDEELTNSPVMYRKWKTQAYFNMTPSKEVFPRCAHKIAKKIYIDHHLIALETVMTPMPLHCLSVFHFYSKTFHLFSLFMLPIISIIIFLCICVFWHSKLLWNSNH